MPAFDLYVALGDSMSSDDFPGPGLGAASLLHRNRDDLYPDFAGQDLRSRSPGIRFLNLTRDGATSHEIIDDVIDDIPAHRGPTLVTLTLGGNDMIQAINQHVPHEAAFAQLVERLARILRHVRECYPDLALRMANLYDPTDGTGVVQSGHDRLARALPHLRDVNDLLRGVAEQHGGKCVDVHGHFLGHGMRHADRTYEHYRADDPSGWIMRDIEPNPRGASELRRLFWRSLS